MDLAIQKAIEGGWMITDREGEAQEWHERHPINENPERIWCDALFWQALCKVLGYDEEPIKRQGIFRKDWEHLWHSFIDHLAEGKDADSYFNALLK